MRFLFQRPLLKYICTFHFCFSEAFTEIYIYIYAHFICVNVRNRCLYIPGVPRPETPADEDEVDALTESSLSEQDVEWLRELYGFGMVHISCFYCVFLCILTYIYTHTLHYSTMRCSTIEYNTYICIPYITFYMEYITYNIYTYIT